ncbi:hypothetical protein Y032_0056g2715 [Ancylostoma ceylanicum]|uniref:Uncharacterized protein n=1 Tax=Ancylostoma ceylanicum TaxID=53326 RepID=A0A016U602_9BILA|nr:hypothetical protein Y032_0056g2715 [Ancylostoma ceylanicum]
MSCTKLWDRKNSSKLCDPFNFVFDKETFNCVPVTNGRSRDNKKFSTKEECVLHWIGDGWMKLGKGGRTGPWPEIMVELGEESLQSALKRARTFERKLEVLKKYMERKKKEWNKASDKENSGKDKSKQKNGIMDRVSKAVGLKKKASMEPSPASSKPITSRKYKSARGVVEKLELAITK